MIDLADNKTVDLFPAKRGRGRPVTGKAKTDAERMRAYRLRKKQRQAVTRIDDIQAGMALVESVYERVGELEKLVFDLQQQRDALELELDLLKNSRNINGHKTTRKSFGGTFIYFGVTYKSSRADFVLPDDFDLEIHHSFYYRDGDPVDRLYVYVSHQLSLLVGASFQGQMIPFHPV